MVQVKLISMRLAFYERALAHPRSSASQLLQLQLFRKSKMHSLFNRPKTRARSASLIAIAFLFSPMQGEAFTRNVIRVLRDKPQILRYYWKCNGRINHVDANAVNGFIRLEQSTRYVCGDPKHVVEQFIYVSQPGYTGNDTVRYYENHRLNQIDDLDVGGTSGAYLLPETHFYDVAIGDEVSIFKYWRCSGGAPDPVAVDASHGRITIKDDVAKACGYASFPIKNIFYRPVNGYNGDDDVMIYTSFAPPDPVKIHVGSKTVSAPKLASAGPTSINYDSQNMRIEAPRAFVCESALDRDSPTTERFLWLRDIRTTGLEAGAHISEYSGKDAQVWKLTDNGVNIELRSDKLKYVFDAQIFKTEADWEAAVWAVDSQNQTAGRSGWAKCSKRDATKPPTVKAEQTPEATVQEAVAANRLEQAQVIKKFFSGSMNKDYDRARMVKPDCYGTGWDGDLFSKYMSETALKVEAAAHAPTNDSNKAVVATTMDVTIDDGRHFKDEQTFFLVLENGAWKIDDIRYQDGRTIHAFFRDIVSRCN